MRLSVVVPTLDEGPFIGRCLDALPAGAEVVVADGGSHDDTVDQARARGARVVLAPPGRAPQLNAGAAAASGDVLLLLHADTTLPTGAFEAMARTLEDPGVSAGCFRVRHVPEGRQPWWFRQLLRLADRRSRRTSLPYGDQAVFLRRRTFDAVGGLPDQPLMEDLELSRRLSGLGRIVTLPDEVQVSARTFERGLFAHGLALNTIPLLYRLGVPAETLARLYRRSV